MSRSSIGLAQLTYDDLRAGYLENVRNANAGCFLIEWRCSRGIEKEYLDAIGEDLPRLVALGEKQEAEIAKSIIEHYIKSLEFHKSEVAYENENFLGRVYYSPQGIRCEVLRNLKDSPTSIPFFRALPIDEFFGLTEVSGSFPRISVIPFDGEIYWGGSQIGGGRTTFAVADKTSMPQGHLIAPISFSSQCIATTFPFVGDELFPAELDDSVVLGESRVSRAGNVAVLEIEGACRTLVYPGYNMRSGTRYRAEIEIDKGFLPRLIQKSRLLEINGKKISSMADHHWSEEIRLDNQQTDMGFFVPNRIEATRRVIVHSPERHFRDMRDLSVSDHLEKTFCIPLESGDRLVSSDRMILSVDKMDRQDAAVLGRIFELKIPEKADRFSDSRTGEVRINAASAERVLALSVDQLTVEPERVTVNKFVLIWGGISVFFVGLLYYMSRPRRKVA